MAPPQLRGLLRKQIYKDVAMAFALAFAGASCWWFGVAVPRRKAYEDFYKNYKPDSITMVPEGNGGF